jgi:hypothetical protein
MSRMLKHQVTNEETFISYMLDTPPIASGGLKRMQEVATQLATGALCVDDLVQGSLWIHMDPIKVLELLARRECANTKPDQEVLEGQAAQPQ